MTNDDLADGWERLRKIYDRLPPATPEVLEEWHLVLGRFDADVFDSAISLYIAKEPYKPNPASLRSYCFQAQDIKRRRQREIDAEEPADICPYCEGAGWFKAINAVYTGLANHPWEDGWYPCQCKDWEGIKINKRPARECLTDVLNDPGWVFDKQKRAFVRRQGWIGDMPIDNRAVDDAEYRKFMGEAGSLFEF